MLSDYLIQTSLGDLQTIATASLFLACKAEDEPCQLSNVVVASYEIIFEWDPSASVRIHQTVSLYNLPIGILTVYCTNIFFFLVLCIVLIYYS